MSSVRHAMAYSMGQRYAAFLIQLGLSMVMARLLTPSETGIYSLAAAVVGIASMLRDFGVSEYVIQEKNLTHDGLRSALGLTFIISWTIAALLFLVSGLVSTFYKEPGIENIVHVLVLNFMLLPLGTMTFAMLNKEMAFKSIFWIQTTANAVGAVFCIWLAYQGLSYMSMAWSSLLSIGTTIVLLALIRPRQTFMLPSFKGLGKASRFGGTLTIGRLADQFCQRMPDFVIGNFLGFHAVGIFSKASSLLGAFQDFFASALGRVALPAFAQIKHDRQQVQESYARVMKLITLFPMAFFGFCGVFAEPMTLFLFGNQWLDAVPLIRILSINGMIGAPYLLAGSVLTANGQVRDLLRIQLVGTALFIPAIYVASHYSLAIVTIAGMIIGLPRLIMMQTSLTRGMGIAARDVIRTAIPSLLIVIIALGCAVPSLYLYQHTTTSALLTLVVAALLFVLVGLGLVFASAHALSGELKIVWQRLARR